MYAVILTVMSCAMAPFAQADISSCKAVDDTTSLLQITSGIKSRSPTKSAITLGGESALVPPVHMTRTNDIQKLGTISTPGTWKPYYDMAENDMGEQWAKIYPLIKGSNFGQVLEIGAGACRNTEKLVPLSNHVLVTDIDPTAVLSCRDRFEQSSESSKLSYEVVDGMHVPAANKSIDLVYQFDSGVHFHPQVIRGYLAEFQRVLVPGGTGFFHHSNLAASEYPVNDGLDVTKNMAWRSNMSRALFETFAREAGLEMLCHPVVSWAGQKDIDAFARFQKPGGKSKADVMQSEMCPEHLDF